MTTLYRLFDAQDRLLYVGISDNVFERLGQHGRFASWPQYAVRITFEQHATRDEAAAAELVAIRTEDPVFNIGGRPQSRSLQWLAAYPSMDPDAIDVDEIVAEAERAEVELRRRSAEAVSARATA